jgi:outer membrane protein TolC
MKAKVIFIILFFGCTFLPRVMAEEILSWEDCILEAKKNNPDLISAQENINQQKASKTITASGLYPQISGNVGAATGKTASKTSDNYSYGVSGTQLVFDAFKTANEINAASENIKAAQQNYRFASSGVRFNLRSAFIELLKAQELIRVAEDIVKIRKENFELITLRYYSGLEHRGALLTAEANLAQATFELSQAKRDIGLAQRQLTKEMGRRELKSIYVKGDFTVWDTAKEKPDLQALVQNNPSLLQLVAKKNAAAFSIKSAYANFAPQLSGNANTDKTSSHWPPQDDRWNLGLNLSMPIFEGGLRFAQVSEAKAVYNQAEANERSTKDAVIVALEQAWVTLQDSVETVDVQYKSLVAAKERAKIAEAQYSTGFITYDNWSIIEDNLVRAKTDYLNAEANALLAEANWIQAKGETLEYAQ